MRLLNTETLQLRQFLEHDAPQYAILSHTWSDEEVRYEDFLTQRPNAGRGCSKIQNVCKLARKRGHNWIWIDTCCVDTRSSAELSETVNAMFRWYSQAVECYAYLEDIGPGHDWESFYKCRWFTRGWTLPELLAPATVIFVNRDWQIVGYKGHPSRAIHPAGLAPDESTSTGPNLSEQIANITGIPQVYLDGEDLAQASMDERISWVENRTTTRVEDMAYCLLGVLGLSLDMRYGEGTKAFVRLRDEIIRWENHDLPDSMSSSRQTIEILKLPRRRIRRNGNRNTRRWPDLPTDESRGIDMQPLISAGRSVTDPAESSQFRHPSSSANDLRRTTSSSSSPKRQRKIPVCWVLIILGTLVVGGSLAVGMYYSIAKDQTGDGFTVASWIIAVGTLALAVPITIHFPHCRCWKRDDAILGSNG